MQGRGAAWIRGGGGGAFERRLQARHERGSRRCIRTSAAYRWHRVRAQLLEDLLAYFRVSGQPIAIKLVQGETCRLECFVVAAEAVRANQARR